MLISVILAHPSPGSFNHAIAHAAVDVLRLRGHDILFHDLYAERFDPILHAGEIPRAAATPPEIEAHCREIARAGGIIIVHPNWWGQPPAILKGWVDRVLRPGTAYEFQGGDAGEGVPIGLLRARSALVFNTSNTPAQRENHYFGDPLETLWKNCIFGLCGVQLFERRIFRVVVTSSEIQRRQWLEEVRRTVETYFPQTKTPPR